MKTLFLLYSILFIVGCQSNDQKETLSLIQSLEQSNQVLHRTNEQLNWSIQHFVEFSYAQPKSALPLYETVLQIDSISKKLSESIRDYRLKLPSLNEHFSESATKTDNYIVLTTDYQEFIPEIKTILDSLASKKMPNFILLQSDLDTLYKDLSIIQKNQFAFVEQQKTIGQLTLQLLQLENNVQLMYYKILNTIAGRCADNRGLTFPHPQIIIDYKDIALIGKPFEIEIIAFMDDCTLNHIELFVENKAILGNKYTYIPTKAGRQKLDIRAEFTNPLTGEKTTLRKDFVFAVLEH